MTSCCRGEACEEMFGSATAQGDMEEYLRHGLGPLESRMVDSMPSGFDLSGARVLEIGGGVGAIQAELLRRGAAHGEVVEVLGAYGPYADRLANELGISDRTAFRVHDLLAEPHEVAPADVVVLNRVVCCSVDGLELAAAGAALTRGALLMSFPRSNAVTRAFAAVQRFVYRLLGRKYRAYVWPEERLIAAAERQGLVPVARGGDLIWRYRVLARGR